MAIFEGTVQEFTRFIGSYCRIKVMSLASKYKKAIGKCEVCNSTQQLEAAHIRGKERPLIISNILSQYLENGIIKIDLTMFEEQFVDAHLPLEKTIRVLCRTCHRVYDKEKLPGENTSESISIKSSVTETRIITELLDKTLNKTAAIAIINDTFNVNLDNRNTLFSNVNSAVDVWWLEPANKKFTTGFSFILNYPDRKKLFYFSLPANEIQNPADIFYQRSDSDYSKLYIPKSESGFIDKRGFDFSKYLVGTTAYK